MKLLIHDLTGNKQKELEQKYEGWTIISDNGTIRPCPGCFSCWTKTPGRCAVHDGYETMGYLLHHAEKIQIISRLTYGGFSPFVKNVFDRSLAYVLPFFEVTGRETHHQKRYDDDKAFSFLFYGSDLSQEEKTAAVKYVQAACRNLRGHIGSVQFAECPEEKKTVNERIPAGTGKTVFLNGSVRGKNANSYAFGRQLMSFMTEESGFCHISTYLNDLSALVETCADADTLVFCVPLFVDGLPSQVLRFQRAFEKEYAGPAKNVYVLANMGLYETEQLNNLNEMMRLWCRTMDFSLKGCLSIGAGELLRVLMDTEPFCRDLKETMKRFARAVESGEKTETLTAGPSFFPRSLYIAVANVSFCLTAKRNKLHIRDLYERL
ncbi:MAG: hypothetical protein K6A40_11900 [Solobacterium sp.]|nr:hypothetical protein [Solobacterium sp.]